MSQYVVFEIVTYAMIESIFELTRNETAISTLISLTPYDSKMMTHIFYILLMYIIIMLFFLSYT